MERLWIVVFTLLMFVAWTSSLEKFLLRTPDCKECIWSWIAIPNPGGWAHPAGQHTKNIYEVCRLNSNQQPNNWLRSHLITVGDLERLYVTLKYRSLLCSPPTSVCNESFFAYVWESNTSVSEKQIPHPINNFSSYRRFAIIKRLSDNIEISTIPLQVKSKFIMLGFRDQGGCRTVYSVKVSYKVCPGRETLKDNLVSLPETLSNLEPSLVEGSCVKDSVQARQGSLIVLCQSNGEWNTSGLQGKCVCKEGMENESGTCKACSRRTYNDGKGLNCTVIPSEPRHASVLFVNESSAVITWLPPAVTGTQTDLMYDVDCRKSCTYFGKDCDDERCDSNFNALLKNDGGLRITNFTINNLAPFVNYTCEVSAKNRVSEVAKRSPFRAITKFTLVNLRTIGSVPGKPDVTIHLAEDGAIELSWQLSCKNGIIQKYRVVYFKVDDSSDTETFATKETGIRMTSLAPGETFEFRVSAVNNFGTGPPGTKTFKMPSGRLSAESKIIIGAAAVCGSLLLVIIITVVVFFIFRFRRKPRHRPMQRLGNLQDTQENLPLEAESIHMHHILPEINTDEAENDALYTDVCETHTFELERKDIIFERLLGSGNFGEVHKAIIGNNTVAVKSLKANATPKDKEDMITELNVMESLRPHPHVVKLIGCCSLRDPLLIVLEYLPYGDLLGYLRKSRGHADVYNSGEKTPTSSLSANDLLSFAWMIADGMEYLAKMKIVHRDLAARNILVGENKISKISDFGLARDVSADVYVRTSQARLPVKWMPPESLFHGESSTMSDVWSYGIVLWEVFTIGDSPYPRVKGTNMAALLERGYRMPRPMHISEELYAIMSECWSEKPEERPSFHWICAAVKRLIDDEKIYINLDYYNDEDYVNFDMIEELQ